MTACGVNFCELTQIEGDLVRHSLFLPLKISLPKLFYFPAVQPFFCQVMVILHRSDGKSGQFAVSVCDELRQVSFTLHFLFFDSSLFMSNVVNRHNNATNKHIVPALCLHKLDKYGEATLGVCLALYRKMSVLWYCDRKRGHCQSYLITRKISNFSQKDMYGSHYGSKR